MYCTYFVSLVGIKEVIYNLLQYYDITTHQVLQVRHVAPGVL